MDAQNTMGLKYHFNEMDYLTDGCKGCYAVELAASEVDTYERTCIEADCHPMDRSATSAQEPVTRNRIS